MIIDGKAIAAEIQQELQQQVKNLETRRKPCLAMILVGEHAPSHLYLQRKAKACSEVGFLSIRRYLAADISEQELLLEISTLNSNPEVDGILVQLPLPSHLNPLTIIHHIDPNKDVDGLHPLNAGKLLLGDPSGFASCTPLGVKTLLERARIPVAGKHAVIMGRSNLVGKPLAALLLQNTPGGNATVTVVHSQTKDIAQICRLADILIVAMGCPQFVTGEMVKEGVVIVDVGINKIANPEDPKGYSIVGDVNVRSVEGKCRAITPVPGGVGPMTIAMLLSNTWKAYQL